MWRTGALLAGLCALVVALAPLERVEAAPLLTVEPDRASCADRVFIRGTNFPPGQVVNLTARAGRSDVVIRFASLPVTVDGTFVLQMDLQRIEPACGVSGGPQVTDGTPYTILATTDDRQSTALASATFILTTSSTPLPGLPNTGSDAQPQFSLEPDRGPCDPPAPSIIARGEQFPPGATIGFYTSSSNGVFQLATTTVAADGTVVVGMRILGCDPRIQEGARFVISARIEEGRPGQAGPSLAIATFTVSSSPAPPPRLPNTGGGGARTRAPLTGGALVAVGLVPLLGAVALGYIRLRHRVG